MVKLRPGRCVRKINSQAWSRYSLRKPKKNYVKALPRTSLLIFNMGARDKAFDTIFTLTAKRDIQLRSNSLEAARQAANKYLERELANAYFMRMVAYPHNVIREKKFATGAGADRISQGMTLSFGRPSAVAARVRTGQTVIEVKTNIVNRKVAKEALKRASSKLSGDFAIITKETAVQAKVASAA
ncbi:50S ribosomal protein L10e [uncultured archaeon]|nr:50S ribosomal protein L10e [uncultured archaeon]